MTTDAPTHDGRWICDQRNGSGQFAGHECPKCGGTGWRQGIEGELPKRRADRPVRRKA